MNALFLSALLAIPAVAAESRFKAAPSQPLDLLVVLEHFAGGLHSADRGLKPDPWCAESFSKRYGALKAHRAVELTRELNSKGFDFNQLARISLGLSDPPALARRSGNTDWFPGPTAALGEQWLTAMRAFSAESGFVRWQAEDAKAQAPSFKALAAELDASKVAAEIEAYTGLPFDGLYRFDAAACHPAGVSLNLLDDGAAGEPYAIHTVFGPSGFVKGQPDWSGQYDLPTGNMWHEVSHGQLDPLAFLYRAEIASSEPLYGRLTYLCYGSWNECVREHIVRAVKQRLILKHLGAAEAKEDMRFEESRGFAYLKALSDQLAEYEADRKKWPNLTAFFPRWVAALDDAARQLKLSPAKAQLSAEQFERDFESAGMRRRGLARAKELAALHPGETRWSGAVAALAKAPVRRQSGPQGGNARGTWESHLQRGRDLHRAAAFTDAVAEFDQALKLKPGASPALLGKAMSLQALDYQKEAVRVYDQAEKAWDGDRGAGDATVLAEILANRAALRRGLGERAQALDDVQRALRSAPPGWPKRPDALALERGLKENLK